jgi:hypothetical protein
MSSLHSVSARRFVALTCALLLSSCAAAGTAGERRGADYTDRDLIVREQLQLHSDVYQAIYSVRPMWLRTRGMDSIRNPSQVWVYLNGIRLGGVELLRTMQTSDVAEIRFYDAGAATQRWGAGHAAGAIAITSRSR